MEHLQAAVRLTPHDPVMRFMLGCSLASRGDLTNAIHHLEEGARWLAEGNAQQYEGLDPTRRLPELLHYKLALADAQAGHTGEAEQEFRVALQLAPDYVEAHLSLAALRLRHEQLDEAGQHFEQAARLLPGSAQAHNGLGIVRQRQHRGPEALACFERAVACDPTDWHLRLNLGFAEVAAGKRDRGIAEFEEALRLEPRCEPARQALEKVRNLAQ